MFESEEYKQRKRRKTSGQIQRDYLRQFLTIISASIEEERTYKEREREREKQKKKSQKIKSQSRRQPGERGMNYDGMKNYRILSKQIEQPSREKRVLSSVCHSRCVCLRSFYVSDFTTSGSVSGSLLEGGGVADAPIPKSCGVKVVTSKEDVPET